MGVSVRRAESRDLDAILAFGRACMEESPRFRDKGWDEAKVTELIERSMKGENHGWFVAESEEGVIGMALGFVVEYFFSRERYVSDLVVYVAPQHRGTSTALRLVAALEEWAFSESINAREVLLGVSTGIETDRVVCVYQRLGYTMVSHSLTKART